jgi:hypothetical protein
MIRSKAKTAVLATEDTEITEKTEGRQERKKAPAPSYLLPLFSLCSSVTSVAPFLAFYRVVEEKAVGPEFFLTK